MSRIVLRARSYVRLSSDLLRKVPPALLVPLSSLGRNDISFKGTSCYARVKKGQMKRASSDQDAARGQGELGGATRAAESSQNAETGMESAGSTTPSAGGPSCTRESERAAFMVVRKNRDACIHWLLSFAKQIEREWPDAPLRLSALSLLRDCLSSLSDHAHADCRELSALAPRMLRTLDFSERHFLNLMLPIERKFSKGARDEDFLVLTDDRPRHAANAQACTTPCTTSSATPTSGDAVATAEGVSAFASASASVIPLVVVLDHLRSAFNVGAIFRTAECLGVERLVLCGYTATPDDAQVRRTAMGTHDLVRWEHEKDTAAAISRLRAAGVPTVGLETVDGAPLAQDYVFPLSGCALLIGNERHGLSPELLKHCDGVVRLPCVGFKNSLNVGVAFGMCAYEIARQWQIAHSAADDTARSGSKRPLDFQGTEAWAT